ncbi:hypothetical protein CHARACLAT_032222 [Characodon lateralis]|uniref:Uncharacterized protein n=1 Tax=Characodon lateralis TaxID=208331 RepID=A0ABU7EEN5_9TELE|nr:hypothetical protein [Characodon lateralis]
MRPHSKQRSRPASPAQPKYGTQRRAHDQHVQPPPNPWGRANRAPSPRSLAPDSSHNQASRATKHTHSNTKAATYPHPTQNGRPTQMQAPGHDRYMHPPP